MADIKRFTGFIAPDGSTHETLGKATAYTKELKIKQALKDFAIGLVNDEENGIMPTGFTPDDRDFATIGPDSIDQFLYAYKDKILAAFNQDVQLRAPRKARIAAAVANA